MPPPAKKTRCDPNTVVLILKKWELLQETFSEKYSTVQRINGFPWRLRLYRHQHSDECEISLICDKSNEAALWECNATIRPIAGKLPTQYHTFTSWNKGGHEFIIASKKVGELENGGRMTFEISTNDDGESCRRIPSLDIMEPRDGILVIGEEKKKIYVNKQSLASQSPYFDRLFFGNFMEKDMNEIVIGDIEYEELFNLIRMIYGFDKTYLTDCRGQSGELSALSSHFRSIISDQSVHRILELADRFQLKFVEDRVVNCLLYHPTFVPSDIPSVPSLSLSIHQKLLMSEQFNLPFLKNKLLSRYKSDQSLLKNLTDSPEFEELSIETVRYLLRSSLDFHFFPQYPFL